MKGATPLAGMAMLGLMLCASARAAHASMIGDTIQINEVNTSLNSDASATGVVNPTLQFASFTPPLLNTPYDIAITDSQITFTSIDTPFRISPNAHMNYVVTDLTKPLIAATVDSSTTLSGFTNSNLQFLVGHALLVDFIALGHFTIPASSRIVIDVVTQGTGASITEPAGVAVMGIGGIGLWLLRRRRPVATSLLLPREGSSAGCH